ncbi:MAG: AI-2E family transporter [Elusimicrobia bacterium]|nr:AI-2E family transporter [Elusimicrobiota bacterium]MDE2510800.1 AI-2E family transporter [Elusimicrobiota bacterium]
MAERRSLPSLSALVVAGAVLYGAYLVREALTPFVLAAAFAYILNPLVVYFEARGLRRSHLVLAAYLAGSLLSYATCAGLRSILVEQVANLGVNAPTYAKQLQKFVAAEAIHLTQELPLPPKIVEHAVDAAVGSGIERLQALPTELLGLLPFLAHALLVPFIGFFFLLDGPDGYDQLIQSAPSRLVEQAIHLMGEIDTALGNYLRGILIVAAAITIVSFVGLFLMGVDNAFAIAALSGVTSFVPYMGAVVGLLVGGGMAWYQFGTAWAGVKVALLFVGIRVADEALLQPVIARHSVHLHPMVFLLALVLGGEVFGFLGLVFAIPAACILKALIKVAWSWYASESGLAAPYSSESEAIPYT